jgi:hypothetical protein
MVCGGFVAMKIARWSLLMGASLYGACALLRSTKPESLPDGTYRLTCKTALDACLTSLDTICHDGYEVIHASEKRERKGPPPVDQLYLSSEAVIRCRTVEALISFGSDHHSESDSGSDAAAPEDATAPDSATAADIASEAAASTGL